MKSRKGRAHQGGSVALQEVANQHIRLPFKIGVLNGYLDAKRRGKRCNPVHRDVPLKRWVQYFSEAEWDGKKVF